LKIPALISWLTSISKLHITTLSLSSSQSFKKGFVISNDGDSVKKMTEWSIREGKDLTITMGGVDIVFWVIVSPKRCVEVKMHGTCAYELIWNRVFADIMN
jgi:hypothetical protein